MSSQTTKPKGPGSAIYLSIKQQKLIIEALDILKIDYPEGHPEQDEIDSLEKKVQGYLNYVPDKRF